MKIKTKIIFLFLLIFCIVIHINGITVFAGASKAVKPDKSKTYNKSNSSYEEFEDEEYKPKGKLFNGKSSTDSEKSDALKGLNKEQKEKIKEAEGEGLIYVPKAWPKYDGAKRSIAVIDFEDGLSRSSVAHGLLDKDSFIQVFYGFGQGLSNMLVSTLHKTGRFEIIEKSIAKKVFEMYTTSSAKQIFESGKTVLSRVQGVRYFVLGSVTDISMDTGDNQTGIKAKFIKLNKGKSISSVTMHMRIIDATTGLIIYSKRLEGLMVGSSQGVGFEIFGVGASFSGLEKTQMGHAIQKLMDQCVDDIISVTAN